MWGFLLFTKGGNSMATNKTQTQTQYYLTEDGLKRHREEYENLVNVERPAAIEQLRVSREFGGDFEDTSVYTSALEHQMRIERKIAGLEEILENVKIIKNGNNSEQISLGSTVRLEIDGEEDTVLIVGSQETQPETGKISNESPVGRALLGRKVGEYVDVETPEAAIRYKILEIS